MNKNTIIIKGVAFFKGSKHHTSVTENNEVILEDNQNLGIYESDIINTIGFSQLVVSWNCCTSEKSFVEIQIKIQSNGKWSQWFSYGRWTDNGNNQGSIGDQKDSIGKMTVDVLSTQENQQGTSLKFKIILGKENDRVESPKVRLVAITLTPFSKITGDKEIITSRIMNGEVDIEVPARSQMIIPDIGNRICSPTSLSMLMAYYGVEMEPFDVAHGCIDNGADIYGNWSYNMAYAGERGFESYVMKCNSVEELKEFIFEGKPVAASIKTSTNEELEGSPIGYPSGHLIVVRGFANKDGENCIIVNDPAAPADEYVKKLYKLREFNQAWSKIIYVIKPLD